MTGNGQSDRDLKQAAKELETNLDCLAHSRMTTINNTRQPMAVARVGASQPMASCLGPSYNSPPQPCSSYDVAQFLLRQRSRTPGVFKGPWNWNRTRRSCRGKSHAIAAEEHHDADPAVGEKSALLCSCCACIPPPLALSSAGSLSRSLAGGKKRDSE